MSESNSDTAPISGSCTRCGCALGYRSSPKGDEWYCCGSCAGSNRCVCGCKREYARAAPADTYVPTRRMFASRHPDDLKTREDREDRMRAFPFPDKARGR